MRSARAGRLLLLSVLLLGPPSQTFAASAEGTFSTEVPPGKWRAVQVRNLPATALVSVEATTSCGIGVAFLNKWGPEIFSFHNPAVVPGEVRHSALVQRHHPRKE